MKLLFSEQFGGPECSEVVNFIKKFLSHFVLNLPVATLPLFVLVRYQVDLMAVKKNCKSKCIFFDFLLKNLKNAQKQAYTALKLLKLLVSERRF